METKAMKIAVSSSGTDLEAPVDLRFGRTQYFVLVESDDMTSETIQNPHMSASGGAGIQTAQMMGNHGVQVVISGILGPNAYQTLRAIGIPIYQTSGGSVREAIETFKAGKLNQITQPGPAHAGMGGRGMGRSGGGMGRKGMNMGSGQSFRTTPMNQAPKKSTLNSTPNEIDELKQQATQLNSQLENISERIKQLEQKSEK
jgi:predicted Fe-Mo cluster-binding NifX family protein